MHFQLQLLEGKALSLVDKDYLRSLKQALYCLFKLEQ